MIFYYLIVLFFTVCNKSVMSSWGKLKILCSIFIRKWKKKKKFLSWTNRVYFHKYHHFFFARVFWKARGVFRISYWSCLVNYVIICLWCNWLGNLNDAFEILLSLVLFDWMTFTIKHFNYVHIVKVEHFFRSILFWNVQLISTIHNTSKVT